ncbi:hypothetical protein [Arthrobacter monumenti]
MGDVHPDLVKVLESAARLQELVPDAILVGGSAAAYYAHHRASYDHDHVLAKLRDRYDMVLDALESDSAWATNRTTYGKIILGELGGIETGIRQLIRLQPLEVTRIEISSGGTIRVPTLEETLRIKAFLVTKRNQTRDYLDVVGLAERMGIPHAAGVLSRIDEFYAGQNRDGIAVVSQIVRQLGLPRPKDSRTTNQLPEYKGLEPRWHDWNSVVEVCQTLAAEIVKHGELP